MQRESPTPTHPCDGHCGLGHVHPRGVLPEGVVLHQEPHQVAPRQELHDHVQVHVVLSRDKLGQINSKENRERKTDKQRKPEDWLGLSR